MTYIASVIKEKANIYKKNTTKNEFEIIASRITCLPTFYKKLCLKCKHVLHIYKSPAVTYSKGLTVTGHLHSSLPS